MPQHYRGLQGAAVIETGAYDLAQHALDYAISGFEIACFFGEAGNGKTFAVTSGLEGDHDNDVHYLVLPGRPSPKQTAAALTKSLLAATPDLTFGQLTDLLLDELPKKRRVLVVDEAQRLGHDALEYLRHLHDEMWRLHEQHGTLPFTLLLVGGNGCYETLMKYPMLRKRVSAWVEFPRLSELEVYRLIPQFHPLYVDVDPKLLLFIDNEYARGCLRDWADFTRKALVLCARTGGPLTEEIVRNAIGWRRTPKVPQRRRKHRQQVTA